MMKTKNTKQTLPIVIILVILALAVTVFALANRQQLGQTQTGVLKITYAGETEASFTMEDISSMEHVELQHKVVSSSYADSEGTFRGVPLYILLDSADPALLDGASKIVARSEDGFTASYFADEIDGSETAIVVYLKDGQPLGSKDEGGTGPFRLMLTDDEFGNRSAKYLCEIEVIE